MKQQIKVANDGRIGDMMIESPHFKAVELKDSDWVDSCVRIYCTQMGSDGKSCFNFQIKSFGRTSQNLTSKANPKHILSTAYFTIKQMEEILAYMKSVENQ